MSLPKLEIMKQKTLDDLLVRLVESEPGINSANLWKRAVEWSGGRLLVSDFDVALKTFRNKGYRVTNKQWYPSVKSQ